MNISLPDELKQFVDTQVSERGYASGSEYLRELIRRQRDLEALRAGLLESLASGPATPMEPDFFDRLRDQARSRHHE